ncbi:transcriptional regulator, LytTR family [Fodinibius roseus]|uniref:Transcriptional regulator, LytTR family n=1 Tax=Fodinibius roseus TaxID=1194090 RepID=A0A1M5B8L9_9BACT|nr:LytTR family DNA-binding domain-containing protein [Fodinibius roseus]SHF38770.1 transcriptional regulator, LytTR family [Fodinibius roseus]
MNTQTFRNLLQQPYPCKRCIRKKLILCVSFSAFIWVFIYYFQPFGLSMIPDPRLIRIALLMSGLSLLVFGANLFLLEPRLPSLFQFSEWTVGAHMLWILWNIVSVCAVYVISLAELGITNFNMERIFLFTGWMFSIAAIPVSLMVLADYLIFYKGNFLELTSQAQELDAVNIKEHQILISSENGKEKLRLRLNELLYITGAGNYIEVYYLSNEEVKKTLLRSSLQKIESQLNAYPVERCHRSFIVNLIQVVKVQTGNQGFELHIRNIKEPIPVSRSYRRSILEVVEYLNQDY